ncbi:DUF2505 domain-containing protein [Saccharomonospora glauca]|jgi:hypothetical protein|uniref:DUF2505 domain-containing protein n=1 Tax=Saccharomonospora glauca K62 TaxID=928724 RepID=I1CX42_9PSEU|nr:DUF2505 domain-containing protein [Saccharomonospora glauca]EIE97266.1 Protein of unknown function (DUF2505) [Saccharomonospora glauca K62]
MATRIEHRATFPHSAADTYAAQTEERALRARLARIGGDRAELRDHETSEHGARYTLLQGIPADKLPSLVRTLRSGDLTVRREHVWTRQGDRYTGTITVAVADVPGRITADVELVPSGDGCVQTTRGEVSVRIPFVGGKIENFVAEQVTQLLDTEALATKQWLAG